MLRLFVKIVSLSFRSFLSFQLAGQWKNMLNESFTQHMDAIKSCSTKQQCSVKVYLLDILHPYVNRRSGDFFLGGGGGGGEKYLVLHIVFFSSAQKKRQKNRLIAGYPYVFLDFLASVCTSLLRFSTFHLVAPMRLFMLNQITNSGEKHELY